MTTNKIKCPKCSHDKIAYGYGINPDKPDEPPRDLCLCDSCDHMFDYPRGSLGKVK